MFGNLIPVTKSGEQLFFIFRSFRENRLPVSVRVRDSNEEATGRVALMHEPKVARGEAPLTPICNLNITLPDVDKDAVADSEQDEAKLLAETSMLYLLILELMAIIFLLFF